MMETLGGFTVPPPSPELRRRVLAAAHDAAQAPARHWIDRLYEDRGLRRALLPVLLALATLLALDLRPAPPTFPWRAPLLDEQVPPAGDPGRPSAAQWPDLAEDLGPGEEG